MDAYMCDIRRDILIRNLVFLRDTLVYKYIKAPLISYGIIPGSVQNEIENSEFNVEKIEKFLLYLSNRAPHRIGLFMDLLSNPNHGYVFVYNHLKDEERECFGQQRILNASNFKVNDSYRNRNEIYRHKLMRLSHQNREEDFRKLQSLGLSKWPEHSDDISSMSADRKRNLADLYFLAVDAEIARRRIKYDTELYCKDWFSEMIIIIPHTSNATQTTMIYLARYGSALSLNGYPHEICVTYLDLALQLSYTIPTCRETGMVLYIYFNMLSKEYERRPAPELKDKLLTMAKHAIDHFENDNEETGRDYKRFLVLKMAMLLLGIGMIGGEFLKTKICQEDKCVRKHCLQSIRKPEMWERMEVRRKMFYFLAYSKFQETSAEKHLAIDYLQNAKRFAVIGDMVDVTEFLCEIWKIVLSQNMVFLRDNLIYSYIRSPLESKGVLPSSIRQKIESSRCNSESVEKLILHLIEIQPSEIIHFLEILADESNGYGFLFKHLKSTYDKYLEGGFDIFSTVSIVRTLESQSRKFSQIYRHTLRRLLNENEMEHFRKLQRFAIDKWEQRNPQELDYQKVVELSDLYFMALDSEAETKRLRFETTNFNEDVFKEMMNIIPNTSNPARSSMQYQSRLGSYLNMSGKPFDQSKGHIMIAFQQSHTVEACCEKGLLFYTYFNLISKPYDDNPNEHCKKELLRVSKCALDIFSLGDEQIHSDFQRVFLIKMAMVYLGIGLFGQELQGINISTDDMTTAEKYLKEVRKKSFWQRMEVRRKMFYFLCVSKIAKLRLDLSSAMRYLRCALLFARKGKFGSEKNNVKKTFINLKTLRHIYIV